MDKSPHFRIITFYEFKRFDVGNLPQTREALRSVMEENSITGTIILADEGFNATVCGIPSDINAFVVSVEEILDTKLHFKSSVHDESPFRKIDVKIKPEIVTLKQPVDISLGDGTHVDASKWNEIISDPSIVVLDARNAYEFKNGTFKGAINSQTEKFSDLPAFVAENLDPEKHPKIAMFCTGGIRCEKFAPYMKQLGFKQVFQLDGGILRYLEQTDADESLWEGECFIFDQRLTLDQDLQKGSGRDHSRDASA